MTLHRVHRVLAVTALAGAMLAVPAAPPAYAANGLIQPGDYIETEVGGCTLNFLFQATSSSRVYFATAAHCVEKVGEDVRNLAGEVFGDVALIGDADVTEHDYAFVEVRSGFVSRVSPAVKGWPQYPTGYTVSSETRTGDTLQQSGYGLGYDLTRLTQEQRFGYLTFDDAEVWGFAGAMNWGDSGGPLVHVRTGKALGIESRVCIGVCTDEGPTIEGVLAKVAARGLSLRLRTV